MGRRRRFSSDILGNNVIDGSEGARRRMADWERNRTHTKGREAVAVLLGDILRYLRGGSEKNSTRQSECRPPQILLIFDATTTGFAFCNSSWPSAL
jgi:hypothetical protein